MAAGKGLDSPSSPEPEGHPPVWGACGPQACDPAQPRSPWAHRTQETPEGTSPGSLCHQQEDLSRVHLRKPASLVGLEPTGHLSLELQGEPLPAIDAPELGVCPWSSCPLGPCARHFRPLALLELLSQQPPAASPLSAHRGGEAAAGSCSRPRRRLAGAVRKAV